jgi:Tol biopolymer transport system component
MTQQTDRLNAALAGRYRIERHLGEGGMASVYLCEDLRHKRKVALKLLKPELAAVLGADRFVQEITTTASLQHPHILPLFDSGTADGFLFYVMPLVEGETLREKLNRETQLGVEEAVRIAREVLDALEYAHQHGIVHRDVKPENILLHGGHAMVADFGIALAVSAAAGGRMTETGLSLGTPHYMSPEQATAEKEITARSDVYSLGSVLYEMLTGQPPHVGGSAQQIIMRIITDSARPVSEIRKSVPQNVVAAVAKSLEKLPADRFESAKTFSDALANPGYADMSRALPAGFATAGRGGISPRLFASAVVLAALAVASAVWSWRAAGRDTGGTAVRFPLTTAPDIHVSDGGLAISPDSKTLVFRAERGGVTMLYARALDDAVEHPISGTEDGDEPFFSPDGTWLGFVTRGQLMKVQLAGGSPVPLGTLPSTLRGATWTKGDVIIVGLGGTTPQLQAIPASGGALTPIAPLDTAHGEDFQRFPLALDDGETVLYVNSQSNVAGSSIRVLSLKTRTTHPLDLPGSTSPLAVIDGKLLYVSATGSLMAVPFDSRSARLTGTPTPVGADVEIVLGAANAAISRTGSLVYQSGSATSQLVLADMHGQAQALFPDEKNFSYPRFSPDGKRLAVGITTATGTDIWIYDLVSGLSTRVTSEGKNDRPEWTPDGARVFYFALIHQGQKQGDLRWQSSDMSGGAGVLMQHPVSGVNEGTISADGHFLAYRLNGGPASEDLWYRRLDGDTTPKAIAATRFLEYAPRFSPDGHWIAYSSDQSGKSEVYVQAFPALGARYPVTNGGGTAPLWASDGRHIYYVADGRVNVATVSTSPGFTVTSRQQLFEGAYSLSQIVHAPYDIAPDGKHLVLIKPMNSNAQTIVVHDWWRTLRERASRAAKK